MFNSHQSTLVELPYESATFQGNDFFHTHTPCEEFAVSYLFWVCLPLDLFGAAGFHSGVDSRCSISSHAFQATPDLVTSGIAPCTGVRSREVLVCLIGVYVVYLLAIDYPG